LAYSAPNNSLALSINLLHDIHYFTTSVVSFPGYPSAYLLVKTEPAASITSSLTKFSEAINSNPCICLSCSSRIRSKFVCRVAFRCF
jgi:hypothetical protein